MAFSHKQENKLSLLDASHISIAFLAKNGELRGNSSWSHIAWCVHAILSFLHHSLSSRVEDRWGCAW